MSKQAYIKDNLIHNMTLNQAFTVQLNSGEIPQISPTIDFEYMPIDVLKKLAFDALKVRGRESGMRGMTPEQLKKAYSGKVSWRALYSKTGAAVRTNEVTMSDDELDAKIKELQAKKNEPKDDFDQAVDDAEGHNE